MMESPKQYARRWRICFRTTRANISWIRSDSAALGITESEYCHWLMSFALQEITCLDVASKVERLASCVGSYERDRLRKSVENGLAARQGDDVPW